ncbi:hypothetical protein [Burkholderia cepacia]|nr:hypothetical protein [Burkholderia cepacia]MDW9249707.1 hypothetical protein [Burkholderia cepacia]
MGVVQVPPELARARRRAFRNGDRASCVQRVHLPARLAAVEARM